MKRIAFTLSEVLITLGIIGVVAALTLPALMAKYKDMVMINQLKKSYSAFLNALNLAKNEQGGMYLYVFDPSNSSTQTAQNILKYMKVAKDCGTTVRGCLAPRYYYPQKTNNGAGGLANANNLDQNPTWYNVILADGSSVGITQYKGSNACYMVFNNPILDSDGNYTYDSDGNQQFSQASSYQCGMTFIDINGPSKGPNQLGADAYFIGVYPDGLWQYITNADKTISENKLFYDKYDFNGSYK
jgi:type II secretory pathway pseudopilin PulG